MSIVYGTHKNGEQCQAAAVGREVLEKQQMGSLTFVIIFCLMRGSQRAKKIIRSWQRRRSRIHDSVTDTSCLISRDQEKKPEVDYPVPTLFILQGE